MKIVNFGKESYIAPSWEEMGELCFELSKKIDKSHLKFDRLIALAKGGLTWSRTIFDYLNIPQIAVFQLAFYTQIAKTSSQPVIIQSLPVTVENERLLVFDDVADSGETLKTANEYLKICGAGKITTASLFVKNWVEILPDFYAQKTDAWIIFPHEVREMISLLYKNWTKEKLSKKEIKGRLLKIGLGRKEVDYFLNL